VEVIMTIPIRGKKDEEKKGHFGKTERFQDLSRL